jgi:hypothetical protein
MPRYRFTYVVETPLSALRDMTFTRGGFPVSLIFSGRIDDTHIRLHAVGEGSTWLAANEALMDNVVSPVLDAISLHQKTPAMLQDLLTVVKAEAGVVRRAVIIEHRLDPQVVSLGELEAAEVQNLLDRQPALPHAVVRWLRYCYRPITVLERFVFSWLALENRAGTTQVSRKCGECGADQPSHPTLNRDEAYAVLHSEHPAMSRDEFDDSFRQWRAELRNPIFHGGRSVTTAMRTRMQRAMDLYRTAVEHDLQRQSGFRLAYPGRLPQDGLLQLNIHHFVEYTTADGNTEFADPPNIDALTRVVERQQIPPGITLLNYDDAQHW